MPPRLLLALPQSLFDRASGAAVSMRHLGCLLAQAGWQVQMLCTSATESGLPGLPLDDEDLGGAALELLSLPAGTGRDWQQHDGGAFEARARALLRDFVPDLLLTFGADALEHRLCTAARQQGCRVLLALHNRAYRQLALPPADALLLPSRDLQRAYAALPLPALVLPPPMWDSDVQVSSHDPVFATFVNPEPEKGAALVARLAARCPDWPFLVVEGRARAADFAATARGAGVDPATLSQVRVVPGGRRLREVLAVTRVVLMPSQVQEAAGRVAAEALANGIPALVSDRGGLPEMVAGTDGVLAGDPAQEATLERWVAALRELAGASGWAAAAARARQVAPRWRSAAQAPMFDQALRALLAPA